MVEPGVSAEMENVVVRSRGLPVETVVSADGTRVAYERSGDGRSVVIVGGALDERATYTTLSEHLSRNFTVFNYDRRGRGASGDGDREQYTIDLEIEDLKAVLRVAGRDSFVFADCTGGMIAVRAAGLGIPMAKLALYEPPYPGDDRPQVPAGYMDRLRALIAADRRGDAVALFQKESVGLSDEFVAQARQHPVWPSLEALAPTLIYDGILSIDVAVPFDLMSAISVPTLVLDGGDSPSWQRSTCEVVARAIPGAQHIRVEGESHLFDQEVVTPYLTEFFSS